jgi:predicted membrane protein
MLNWSILFELKPLCTYSYPYEFCTYNQVYISILLLFSLFFLIFVQLWPLAYLLIFILSKCTAYFPAFSVCGEMVNYSGTKKKRPNTDNQKLHRRSFIGVVGIRPRCLPMQPLHSCTPSISV